MKHVGPILPERDTTTSPFVWWETHRLRYSIGLVVAGVLAFIAYVVVGSTLLPIEAEFEVSLFTTVFQAVGYFVMIGIANVCYFLGPLSERFIHPTDPERYRRICYRLGFWFSFLLPCLSPG